MSVLQGDAAASATWADIADGSVHCVVKSLDISACATKIRHAKPNTATR